MNSFREFIDDVIQTPFVAPREMLMLIGSTFIVCQLISQLGFRLFESYKPYSKLPHIEKAEWQTRIVSTLHAVIVFPIAVYVVCFEHEYRANPVFGKSDTAIIAFAMGVGYFFSDFVMVLFYRIPPMTPIILHHVFAGWGFLIAVGPLAQGAWYGVALLLTEASTPLNNTHWMLMKSGKEDTFWCTTVGKTFAISWFFFRILPFPYILYMVYLFWSDLMHMKFYVQLVLGLNIAWLMFMNYVYFFTGPFKELMFGAPKKRAKTA